MARLVPKATSSVRSCDYSPRCHHHHARTLSSDWHNRHQDAAVGCPLGPYTTQETRGEYLKAKATPSKPMPPNRRPAAEDETAMRTTPTGDR
jgi:hypothetical protein